MTPEELDAAKGGWVTTNRPLGVGVLLATLLVEASEGRFEIQSNKGEGTCVTIYLPLEP